MQVLERLGLDDAVARHGVALSRIELRDAGGARLQHVDLKAVQRRFGQTTVSIHRGALQQALVERLPADALHLGKTCVAVDEREGGVRVRFEDGTHVEASLVVGADGLRSAVRDALFPQAQLRYAGQTCYRGVADLALPDSLLRTAREVWGPGQRFGFSAIGERAVYWFAPVDAVPGTSVPASIKEDLLRRYASFPAPTAAILEATPAEAIIQTDLYDLRPLDRWWRGRVVLLGDAAHAPTPNLGQGAAQAIEDAYALAACLARHGAPHEAFAAYETTRMPKAKQIVRRSWWLGKLAHVKNPVLRRVRNGVLRHTPAAVQRRELEAMYTVDA